MNSAAAAEATSGSLTSALRSPSYDNTTSPPQSSSSPPHPKPKFELHDGSHDDSPLKIAMDQFPGSSSVNLEEGLVQRQSAPPPQSSKTKRASFDDAIDEAVGLGGTLTADRVSFDDNAPSVKEYSPPSKSADHSRKARLSVVSKMYGKFISLSIHV